MPLFLDCPHGLQQGQGYTVSASGSDCRDAISIVWSNSGLPGGVTATPNANDYIITTQPTSTGSFEVTVICTGTDGEQHTETCEIFIYEEPEFVGFETSEPLCVEFADCNVNCFCTDIQIEFDCSDAECFTESATIVVQDCAEAAAEKICPDVEPIPEAFIIGTKPAYTPIEECLDLECDCECEEEDLPHNPVTHWNNICSCPTWVVTGAGINDTTAANTCGCAQGRPWVYNGVGNWTATGTEPAFVDSVVIWGHNLLEGCITTEPIPPTISSDGSGGNPYCFSSCYDNACIGGFTRPIVIDLQKCCYRFEFQVQLPNENLPDGPPDPPIQINDTITNTNGGSASFGDTEQFIAWLLGNGFTDIGGNTYRSECLKYEEGLWYFGGGPAPLEQAYKSSSVPLSPNGVNGSVSWEPIREPITDFNMLIDATTIDGGPAVIQHISVGEKFFYPEDGCGLRFTNPHDGTQCEFTIKESECGILSRDVREVMVPWSITIEDMSENWAQQYWRPLLRYLCAGNPFIHQWSRNRSPGDVFYGFIDGINEGSTYQNGACRKTVTLDLTGYINQPQEKEYISAA